MTSDVRHQMIAILPRLRRFSYSLTGSMDDADDLMQSVCEKALTRLNQFTPGTRLDSWLFRIAVTVWTDRIRYQNRRQTVDDPEAVDGYGYDARIHEGMEARMDLEIVRREVRRLPSEQQLVLSLVTIDGMSYQEAADVLDVPIGTVMSRLARARKKLMLAVESGGLGGAVPAGGAL